MADVVEAIYPDGGKYIGQLSARKEKDGKGIYTYASKDIYFGGWKNDLFHGQGIYIFANGEIYDGLIH